MPSRDAFIPPDPDRRPMRRPRLTPLRVVLLSLLTLALLPVLLIALFTVVPVPVTSYMLQSPVKPTHHRWVPGSQIADVARKAVVAAEDQKFFDHNGFDMEALEKAYANNKKGRRIRGGSTISQQIAKNLFLWPGGGYFRKGVEAGLTVLIETFWTKNRILEVYLNSAEFGPGIYGVEAASQRFFGKPAARLSAPEAALLASVLPNPRKWKVAAPGPYVRTRAAWIQRQMGYGGRPPRDEAEPLPPANEMPVDEDAPASPEPEEPATPASEQPAAPADGDQPPAEPTPVPSEAPAEPTPAPSDAPAPEPVAPG